jgi:predicted phage-related endonuclease
LWSEKCGFIEREDISEKEHIKWGNRLEPFIIDAYTEVTGNKVTRQQMELVHPDHQWMFCHVDGVVEGQNGDGEGIFEAKNVSGWKADDWEDEPPLAFQVQVQHEMACSGHRWADIAALIGGNKFRWGRVQRNESFIHMLIEKEAAFWKLVQDRTPPEPAGTDEDVKLLGILYPGTEQVVSKPLPHDLLAMSEELDQVIGPELKRLEEREKLLKNHIRQVMGELGATVGVLPNGNSWTWKLQTRNYEAKPASTWSGRVLNFRRAK